MMVVWAFLFWSLLGLFFASQYYLLGAGTISWRFALIMAMPQWYVWGLLAPAIARVDRSWLSRQRLGRRLAWHLPLGVAWTMVALGIRLLLRFLPGRQLPPSLVNFVIERFNWDLLIYAVIAGVAVARDYARQAMEQEREAHRLQLEAEALQRTLAEARLQALRSQLQPHFLFNALNTMSALTGSDPRTARRLMEQLGQLLRASLRHAATPLVSLAEELTFLDDYLAIETVRFDGRISVTVRADDDTLESRVPSFLLQPLVENAIRHGVGPRATGGRIEVTATRDGDRLQMRVSDNGVGLSADWLARRGAGVGLRNTAARLEQLYPRAHVFDIAPASSGRGVDVTIDVPWQPVRAPLPSANTPVGAPA